MSDGKVLHGSLNGVEVLKFSGDVRYNLSMALDSYIQKLLENDGLKGFVIDMTETDAIDSTNLGILARLARSMQRLNLPKVTLICNQSLINEILVGMGFDKVFRVVKDVEFELERMTKVPEISSSDHDIVKLLLESHRMLIELNATNRAVFRDVVMAFESDIRKV
ncbi:MAG: STAS domain-containing protein [Gammaproteobacteria bacterium]|nr:STAS domain-containing protein [Gammaproteobacteria bacterium]